MRFLRLLSILLAQLFLVQLPIGFGQTFNLTNGVGSWTVDGNWTPNTHPNAIGAAANFGAVTGAGGLTVSLSAGVTVGSLSVTNNNSGVDNFGNPNLFTLSQQPGGLLTFDQTSEANAQLNINGTSTIVNNVTITTNLQLIDSLELNINNTSLSGTAGVLSGAISGNGGLIKNGDGGLALTTAQKTYTGATVINAGYLRFDTSGTANATSSITVNSGGQLRLDTSNGAFSFGNAAITLSGTGTASSQGAIRNQATGSSSLSNKINIAAGGATIHVNNSGSSLQLDGNLSGTGLLTKTGGGSLFINGSGNTHSGGIAVTNGIVTANAGSSISGPLSLAQTAGNSTTFNINSSQTVSALSSLWTDTTGSQTQTLNLNGSGTNLNVNQETSTTFGNGAVATLISRIAGDGSLTKSGAGTLTLGGSNTYTGGTTVSGGKIVVTSSGSITHSGASFNLTGGEVEINGSLTASLIFVSGGVLSGAGTLNTASYTLESGIVSAQLTGAVTLNKTTSGSVTLSGASSSVGTVSISAGVLELGSGASLSAGLVTVSSGGTFDIDGTLTAPAGIDLNTGATLKGAGAIVGDVNLNGILSPGNSVGTMSINGNLNLTASSVLNFELDETNRTPGSGVNDFVAIAGDLVLDGTLNVPDPATSLTWTTNATSSGPLIWTLMTFSGSLTNNGLQLGNLPTLLSGNGLPQSWELLIIQNSGGGGSVNLQAVPEPASPLILAGGLLVGTIARRRRRRV